MNIQVITPTRNRRNERSMIQWMQDFRGQISVYQWECLYEKELKFTDSQALRENWHKIFLDGIQLQKTLRKQTKPKKENAGNAKIY